MLSSDVGQEGRQDLLQLLYIQVPPFHSPFVDTVGCATQQVGLWVNKGRNSQQQIFNTTQIKLIIYSTTTIVLNLQPASYFHTV